jgi:putative tryptophan/tyrosine transport system substrate-binding protein
MKRRELLRQFGSLTVTAASSVLLPSGLHSQPASKRPAICYVAALVSDSVPEVVSEDTFKSVVRGLADLGYTPGQNYELLPLFPMLPDLRTATEDLVNRVKPDLIVPAATLEAVAVRKATSTIPLVCPALADGVHLGLIASEAHPGGNLTGIQPYIRGLPTKQIELARDILPQAKRLGLLTDLSDPKGPPQLGDLKTASEALGFETVVANVSKADELPGAIDSLVTAKVDLVFVMMANIFLLLSDRVAALALERRMPTVYGYREHVVAGGLVSYGVDLKWCFHRAGYFVDKILKGARPGDLPIEFPTQFPLAINLRTAKALGVTVPPSLLARADEVIE